MIVFVAAGGALGAVGRYGVVSLAGALIGHGFPYGTVIVNIVGSFVLGAVIETSALMWSPSPEIRAMIVVGVLGAFTTFSTFSLDVVTLVTRGENVHAMLYVIVSVVASIAALWGGMALTRVLIT
ncbi:MAG: fluoride efflux transporter CrcB [Rhodospirillales bacterium]|nr:fluoride efflux transporter CrcB [Rhodospirillales bacterium]MBO6786427.1 fluoride efflux transporter CrcB [Rhodospirillales bacterium]